MKTKIRNKKDVRKILEDLAINYKIEYYVTNKTFRNSTSAE